MLYGCDIILKDLWYHTVSRYSESASDRCPKGTTSNRYAIWCGAIRRMLSVEASHPGEPVTYLGQVRYIFYLFMMPCCCLLLCYFYMCCCNEHWLWANSTRSTASASSHAPISSSWRDTKWCSTIPSSRCGRLPTTAIDAAMLRGNNSCCIYSWETLHVIIPIV